MVTLKAFICSSKKKVNINATDHEENTPLHCAAKFGYKEIIIFLLNAKAQSNIFNNEGLLH